MNEAHVYDNNKNYTQIFNALQFRLSRIKKNWDFFIEEMMEEKKWLKYLMNPLKHSTMLIKLCLCCRAHAMVFLFAYLKLITVLKIMGKKTKQRKIVLFSRSNLDSININTQSTNKCWYQLKKLGIVKEATLKDTYW